MKQQVQNNYGNRWFTTANGPKPVPSPYCISSCCSDLRSLACWLCSVFLNQLISGSGIPVATQVSFTVSPSLTVVSTLEVSLSI